MYYNMRAKSVPKGVTIVCFHPFNINQSITLQVYVNFLKDILSISCSLINSFCIDKFIKAT